MINLEDDCLSFTFPEIAQQLHAHVERQIGHILPETLRPEERTALLAELESRWEFQQLDGEAQDRHRLRVLTLTVAEIEAALRTAALRAIQAPVRRSLLAGVLPPGYPFPMPAAVRREFTLQALEGALAAAARQVRESLMKKGLPRYILEDGVLIRIAPDGTRKPMRRTSAVAKRGPKPGRRGH